MPVPCPIHKPTAWKYYLRTHPGIEQRRFEELAMSCCPDCAGAGEPSSAEQEKK